MYAEENKQKEHFTPDSSSSNHALIQAKMRGTVNLDSVMQLAKITNVKPSKPKLEKKNYNNWVHFNLQMSGDSRMAIAGVGLAIKNETRDDTHNGLLVSVPKNTEKTESTDVATVDKKLHGLIGTHGVAAKTEVYATQAENPHESRKESLDTWKQYKPDSRNLQKYDFNVFQTGLIGRYVNYYESNRNDKSLKDSLSEDYGADGQESDLGKKLKAINNAGNAVLWFKGDPAESDAINSLQTAKTEHWMSVGMGNKILTKVAAEKKVAIAGTLNGGMKAALGNNVTNDNQFTTDKLIGEGYNNIGKQYGFFNQYSNKMTHFGGRSGHLEPIAAMGIKTIYFEETGNGQAGRDVHIGKDNAMDKVVIDGVGSLAGVISKSLSWMKYDGTFYNGNRGPSAEQKTLMNGIVRKWLKLGDNDNIDNTVRQTFYQKFVAKTSGEGQHKQDRDKSMKDNSATYKAGLDGQDLTALETGTISDADANKIVAKF